MERSFYVVVYDVVNDKRRQKVAKYMESIGDRVQKSVFEIYLSPPELEKVLKKTGKLINIKEDSLRVYNLCSACRGRVQSLGVGRVTRPPEVMIV